MQIDNQTCWRTDQMRRILERVAAEEFEKDPGRIAHLKVKIVYTRQPGRCSGYAWYHSNSSVLRVPNPDSKAWYVRHYQKLGMTAQAEHYRRFPPVDFAFTAAHEFGHNKNLKHAEMKLHHVWGDYAKQHFAWAKDYAVERQAVPAKPTLDQKRAKALKVAVANVAKYQRRLKLDQTLLKKWQRKVRTLEKRMAALPMAASPAHEPLDVLPAPCENNSGGEQCQ